MALFEERRQARIAASFEVHDPSVPINCVDCGEIVTEERLNAYPRTRRCTPCAADVERRYRDGSLP